MRELVSIKHLVVETSSFEGTELVVMVCIIESIVLPLRSWSSTVCLMQRQVKHIDLLVWSGTTIIYLPTQITMYVLDLNSKKEGMKCHGNRNISNECGHFTKLGRLIHRSTCWWTWSFYLWKACFNTLQHLLCLLKYHTRESKLLNMQFGSYLFFKMSNYSRF